MIGVGYENRLSVSGHGNRLSPSQGLGLNQSAVQYIN
jgi:hypothetical protein